MELFSLRSAVRTLDREFTFTGLTLCSPGVVPCNPPVRLNSSQKGDFVTICKYNGRRRRSPGKSVEEKQKEFMIRKEELLRKSRGETSVTVSSNQNDVHDVEFSGGRLLANGDGAVSVSTLPPMDERYYPVANPSARDRFRPSSGDTQGPDKYSLSHRFSEILAEKAARESGKKSAARLKTEHIVSRPDQKATGAASSSIEHTVTWKVDKKQAARPAIAADESPDSRSAIVDDESLDSSKEEGYEEWVEVGLNDVGEDEEEEEVEYWEGDLPPMTPEEEEELLKEAERELAELEKLGDAGKDPEFDLVQSGKDPELDLVQSENSVDLERVEMERKLAKLKNLVHQMQEQLAGDNKWTGSPRALTSEPKSDGVRKIVGTYYEQNLDERSNENDQEDLGVQDEDELGEEEFEVASGKFQQPNGSDEIRIATKRIDLHYRRQRQDDWEGNDDDVVKEDRGVPAVMRCFDRAKVYVKAGDGGNGVVAFRREKFVPFGGPYGGNGGRGGQVYFEADTSMNSLLPFRKAVHFRAGRGSHGGGKRKEGAVGTDCNVKVPTGTVIREAGPEGKVLLELTKPGQREMLLPGGAGGRGNAAFKTGRNNAPQLAEFGEAGVEMWVELELKLVADVGIVGVPNAGKSTLLSAISAAKPEIANYPFTTLLPNLGVVALDYDATMVVADLPGLLEGAHTGIGLGHEFLRHTERCRVLVHVVDGTSSQPEEEFEAVRLELQLFKPILSEKPFVVAFNKMDIPEASERWDTFRQSLRLKGIEPFCMSAATQEGTSAVISAAHALLKEQKRSDTEDCVEAKTKAPVVAEMVRRQRSAPIENFTVEVDKHTRTWQVTGAGLERFTQMTNWEYFEAVRRFQRVLSASGVNKALRERGIREGETVIVAQMEFNWIDSEDMSALTDWKRGGRGSKVWPH